LSEIRRSDIFREYFDNNFHVCPIIMSISEWEWEHEFVKLIGKALYKTRDNGLPKFSEFMPYVRQERSNRL
jgi:predicted class III extradiol MEMO1 family dioxygenase